MLDKLSLNEMKIIVLILRGKANTPTELQMHLKPKIRGSTTAYGGIMNNVNALEKLNLITSKKIGRRRVLKLTSDGEYYAELLKKINGRSKK